MSDESKETDLLKEPDLKPYGIHYTYADYLKFTFEERIEIINGELFYMELAPGRLHQTVSGRIYNKISTYLEKQRAHVYYAPFDVVLPVKGKDIKQSDKVVQPDITLICNPLVLDEKGCLGTPDWVIEILSEGSKKRDYQDKFDLYEEAGVGEYWIADPVNETIEVFVLKENAYQRIRTYVEQDIVPSHTLNGLTIDLSDIFYKDEV
jgi:Uma2 family endonuclease